MMKRLSAALGVTAAGLPGARPSDVRSWTDKVRSNALDPAERAATLVLVHRIWLIALLLKAAGGAWDIAWHFRWLRDDFAPPHLLLMTGEGVAIALVVWHWYTRFAVDVHARRLMLAGIALAVVFAPIDLINHRINGLDVTAWSIPHFVLYNSTTILIVGVLRTCGSGVDRRRTRPFVFAALWFFLLESVIFPTQQQEYGVLAVRDFVAGHPTADPELLEFARDQAHVATLGVDTARAFALPMPDWLYPVWLASAAMLVLVAARRSVGRRWTASVIAGGYVGWRILTGLVLHAAGFPPSTVPFLLLSGAAAIDLVFVSGLPPTAEAALGAVATAGAVYLGSLIQTTFSAAPPASYGAAPIAAAVLLAGWLVLTRSARSRRARPARSSPPVRTGA